MIGRAPPGWPGAGTFRLPASEAHAFTVHEFARPAAASWARSGAKGKWALDVRVELAALLDAPDRPVTPADLCFAASARCRCGAGFCYPRFTRDHTGSWFCSAVLLGTAVAGTEHDNPKPFAFWDVKSEDQPSARGETTRPKEST